MPSILPTLLEEFKKIRTKKNVPGHAAFSQRRSLIKIAVRLCAEQAKPILFYKKYLNY